MLTYDTQKNSQMFYTNPCNYAHINISTSTLLMTTFYSKAPDILISLPLDHTATLWREQTQLNSKHF